MKMKHLYEYEEEEVRSLMGDLDQIGHEHTKGWYVEYITDDGYYQGIVFIAKNNQELFELGLKAFNVSKGDILVHGEMYKSSSGGMGYENPLSAMIAHLSRKNEISYSAFYEGLEPRGSFKSLCYYFPATNPYATIEIWDKYFINAKSIIDSPGNREDLEMESSLVEL
jgi:hypothetical protein